MKKLMHCGAALLALLLMIWSAQDARAAVGAGARSAAVDVLHPAISQHGSGCSPAPLRAKT